ncbi:hypothetical protein [Phocaeicola salanitronis]|uniref:hypothetical protein n=1 Tax=Phocaeicola salanitronis TaxID=376805 RepID=UPI0023F7BE17|nr:hypothetical protein [Phocaeicola salanitronis]
MFTELIARILGAERRSTTSNRLENNAAPSVTARKDSTEKYQKDIAALEEKHGKLSTQTELSISLTLKEALVLMPRNRKRIDAYAGLISYLKREYGITLTITSQKTKP